MSKITTHHHVLAVPDAQQTAEFFVRHLGFEHCPVDAPGWRFVARDGFMIMLGSCPDAIPPRDLGDHSYFAYLVVDDIDAYRGQITSTDLDGVGTPEDKPWGMREFHIRTPDGHRMMVGQEIGESKSG